MDSEGVMENNERPIAMDLLLSASLIGTNVSQQYNSCTEMAQELRSDIVFHHVLYEILVPVVFSIVAVVGLVGNSLVIYTIAFNDHMHSCLNILLVNLAVADLLFLLICVPFTAYHYASPTWSLGDILCHISPYPLFVAFYVTMYTLVFISAWRFVTVTKHPGPVNFKSIKAAVIASLIIWVTSATINVPTLFMFRVVRIHKECWDPYEFCGETNKVLSNAVYMTFFIAGYVGPLLVMSGLYLALVQYVRHHAKIERTRHVTRLILLVVLAFCICWLPLQIHIIMAYFSQVPNSESYHIYRLFCHCLAYINSCMNPVIYGLASKPLRDSFKETISCCKGTPRNIRPSSLELIPLNTGTRIRPNRIK